MWVMFHWDWDAYLRSRGSEVSPEYGKPGKVRLLMQMHVCVFAKGGEPGTGDWKVQMY